MTTDTDCRYEGYDNLMASLRANLKELFSECSDFKGKNKDFLKNVMLDRMTIPKKFEVGFINATLDKNNQRIHITIYGASMQQLEYLDTQLKELSQADIIKKKLSNSQSDEFAIQYHCNGDQAGKHLAKALHNTATPTYG